MNYMRIISTTFITLVSVSLMQAQTLPVGTIGLEDMYRRSQINGHGDSSVSHTIKPLFSGGPKSSDLFFPDSAKRSDFLKVGYTRWITEDGKFKVSILPFNFQLRFNSTHPHGWNDGALIPAKGIQSLISGGVFADFARILTLQLNPEIILASNPSFEGFTPEHYDVIAARYYDFYNFTDLPQRFGKDPYSKILWGQSSLRLNYKGLSFGISNENLWWGPGLRSSLLMSNSAPGFKHITLNTSKPLKTPVGSVEGQLVAGRLEGSGFDPLSPGRTYLGDSLNLPKPDDWRYFSGLALSWQPKWVPGLFFGLTRSFQSYSKDVGDGPGAYLPVLFQFQNLKRDESLSKQDQYGSLYMRWVWPEEKAEIYFEYGRNSGSANMREKILEPENNRAYLFGLRKLLSFRGRSDEQILVGLEVTQLQQVAAKTVLDARSWYLNKYVRHGYTHLGEPVGAGIGPGGGLQSLNVSWVKGVKRLGIQLERYAHNNDFYYYAYTDSQDWRRHWVDMGVAASGEWDYKNLLFNAQLQYIKSINYQWYLLQTDPNQYVTDGLDKSNMCLQLGISYRF